MGQLLESDRTNARKNWHHFFNHLIKHKLNTKLFITRQLKTASICLHLRRMNRARNFIQTESLQSINYSKITFSAFLNTIGHDRTRGSRFCVLRLFSQLILEQLANKLPLYYLQNNHLLEQTLFDK